ncbi:MAG TPA: PBECR2 nuclease fold domain-containing protein [Pseudobdellovibrionaceae bacterium]|nr:PBECR2 nuclease fold domain-containing protein [Pseudobdellovibrionaceae bacterium]
MAKSKSRGKKRTVKDRDQELIVIDEQAGLIFESEKELSAYFQGYIDALEEEYQGQRRDEDFSDEEQLALEEFLEPTLDEPDEIWRDDSTFRDLATHVFIREFEEFAYVVIAYLSSDDEEPTFVLTHFPTKSAELVDAYRRGELIYDLKYERVQGAAIEGDALSEGDPLAMGLYVSMLKVRSEKDIPEADFQKFADQREETIESPDEIWRKTDMDGNILVSFIREVPDHLVKELTYVAVAQEESEGGVHSLLFSFPTTDRTLVDRYRQGENLQAEEVVQENSH